MNKKLYNLQYILHAVVWLALLFSPLMFVGNHEQINIGEFIINGASSIALLIIVFYLNFFYLVPKQLLKGGKRVFWITNIVLILLFAVGTHVSHEALMRHDETEFTPADGTNRGGQPAGPERDDGNMAAPSMGDKSVAPPAGRDRLEDRGERTGAPDERMPQPDIQMKLLFILRDVFNLSLSAIIATALVVSRKWAETEEARKRAESAKTEAELRNLRNQINPHFLLNTLNNIYALIAFDTAKAQEATHELSNMLRHILYDNQRPYVSLTDEMKFTRSYIDLMKIRLAANVEVKVDIQVPDNDDIKIAPLIFISLIENAFKHGISPVDKSFIHINIKADERKIECCIVNSNHPKSTQDRSGHGIGLHQVEQRLNLSYKGKYEWAKGPSEDNTTYSSKITIYDTKMHDN